MKLNNKVVVITGGSRGLGKAMAEILIKKGARIVLCSKDAEALKKTADELGAKGFSADVTNETDILNLAENTVNTFGQIDIWINNAGVWLPPKSIVDVNLDDVRNLFNINIFGTINGMRAAVKQMSKQGHGTIVNIISTTAFDGMNGSSGSIYVASKYALRGLTNVVRQEIINNNINLIGVYPGGIKTDLFNKEKPANIDQFLSPEDVAQKIIENIELDKPEEQLIIKRPGQALSSELK